MSLGGNIKKVFVYAAGGLGNQLFQLAAGYSISSGREVVCEVGFSGPRKNLLARSVLESLSLDGLVILRKSNKLKRLTQALLDYLLRVSTKTSGPESVRMYRALVSLAGSLYFSVYYKCFLVTSLSKGVGYCPLPKLNSNQMIIGYFQSHRYLEDDKKESFLNMLTLSNPGPQWLHWSQRARDEKPIIVHIRLGDYLLEKSFGIVTDSYISESLSRLGVLLGDRPLWVFSDQKTLASSILPTIFSERAVWVPEIDSNPMATLSVMRLGTGYVIANSSFSWWAAWSRQILESPVYCPYPWFSGSETPKDLLPAHWIQVETNFKDQK